MICPARSVIDRRIRLRSLEREAQAAGQHILLSLARRPHGPAFEGLATNIDFGAWADYLGDPPLATAFLDRLVDGAVILRLTGRSYRAHRAAPYRRPAPAAQT